MSGSPYPPPVGVLDGAASRVQVERAALPPASHGGARHRWDSHSGVLCAVLAAGCTGALTAHHFAVGAPVSAVAPTRAPVAVVAGDCVLQGGTANTASSEQGLVTVDRSPSGVVILWVPALNQRPCLAELVHAGPGVARRLAAAIDTAPATPRGTTACTAADNTGAETYLLYPSKPSERADVSLSGCEGIDGPIRDQRQLSHDLVTSLLPLAPGPWRIRLPNT